jgi:hypothetical protein
MAARGVDARACSCVRSIGLLVEVLLTTFGLITWFRYRRDALRLRSLHKLEAVGAFMQSFKQN